MFVDSIIKIKFCKIRRIVFEFILLSYRKRIKPFPKCFPKLWIIKLMHDLPLKLVPEGGIDPPLPSYQLGILPLNYTGMG